MTLDEMLAVEIRLLASHYSPLTLDLLQKEYPELATLARAQLNSIRIDLSGLF